MVLYEHLQNSIMNQSHVVWLSQGAFTVISDVATEVAVKTSNPALAIAGAQLLVFALQAHTFSETQERILVSNGTIERALEEVEKAVSVSPIFFLPSRKLFQRRLTAISGTAGLAKA